MSDESVFVLKIGLNDDDMQTGSDIARALRRVADTVEGSTFGLVQYQDIRDDNGNNVGQWEVQ